MGSLRAGSLRLVVALVFAGASVPRFARAQEGGASDEREAHGLFELGSEAYNEARYERALKYFQDAYALSKRPGLLYNLGLTYSNLRRDQEAIDAFERYLAEVPNAENREAVRNRIALLKKGLEPAPAAAARVPAPVSAPASTAPPVAPTPEEAARAQVASAPPPAAPANESPADEPSGGVHTKWWFWAGIGGAVAAGVLIGVAASGGNRSVEGPVLLDDMTRVREL